MVAGARLPECGGGGPRSRPASGSSVGWHPAARPRARPGSGETCVARHPCAVLRRGSDRDQPSGSPHRVPADTLGLAPWPRQHPPPARSVRPARRRFRPDHATNLPPRWSRPAAVPGVPDPKSSVGGRQDSGAPAGRLHRSWNTTTPTKPVGPASRAATPSRLRGAKRTKRARSDRYSVEPAPLSCISALEMMARLIARLTIARFGALFATAFFTARFFTARLTTALFTARFFTARLTTAFFTRALLHGAPDDGPLHRAPLHGPPRCCSLDPFSCHPRLLSGVPERPGCNARQPFSRHICGRWKARRKP